MASDKNIIVIEGNVCRKSEIKEGGSWKLGKVGIASNSYKKLSSGEFEKETVFIDVKKWVNDKESFSYDVGDSVVVMGKLKLESWTKDGQKRSKHTIMAEKIIKGQREEYQKPQHQPQIQQPKHQQTRQQEIFEDDIPF